MNQRIKQVRQILEITQRDFSEMLSLSSGYISGVEAEARTVNDRLVKLIVSQFGINEKWLRTGKGKMFSQPATDEKSAKLLSYFDDLPEEYQDVVLGVIELLRKAHKKSIKGSLGRKLRDFPPTVSP